MSDLAEYFRSQANWRWAKAEEYPEDNRNEQSARALESLAEYVEPDENGNYEPRVSLLQELDCHLFEQFHLGGEETARMVSRYGFDYRVTDTGAFHEGFLEELAQQCRVDAYESAAEHGEDWTETLYECELEAARDGIVLPPYYWQRRPKWFEAEAEAAVQEYRQSQERDEAVEA